MMEINADILEIVDMINIIMEDEIITEKDLSKNIYELGLDSVQFVLLAVELENKYDIIIFDEYLVFGRMSTVNAIFEIVQTLIKNKNA